MFEVFVERCRMFIFDHLECRFGHFPRLVFIINIHDDPELHEGRVAQHRPLQGIFFY
jgi:hypothetical protein